VSFLRIVESTVFEAVPDSRSVQHVSCASRPGGVQLLAHVYGVLQSYSDCISGGLSTRQVHVALVSVFWRLHATVIAITVLCFFGDCVLCAVEVYLQRKSLVDCVVVSLRIVEGTVFEAVPNSRSVQHVSCASRAGRRPAAGTRVWSVHPCRCYHAAKMVLSLSIYPSMYKHLSPFVHAQHLSIYLSV